MGLETDSGALFGVIEKRAEDERARIRTDAETRASEILAAAAAEIERLKAEARRKLRKELEVDRQRLLGNARMQARVERLRAKRRLLAETFRRAGEEVARLSRSEARPAVIESLVAEARVAIGNPCNVEVSAADDTVIAASPDGRRRADNSLATRMRKAETAAEPEVARRLFGGRDRDHAR